MSLCKDVDHSIAIVGHTMLTHNVKHKRVRKLSLSFEKKPCEELTLRVYSSMKCPVSSIVQNGLAYFRPISNFHHQRSKVFNCVRVRIL